MSVLSENKRSLLLILAAIILSLTIPLIVTLEALGIIISLLIIVFVLNKVAKEKLLFLTGCSLPIVYIPLALTGGSYVSFTYLVMFLCLVIFIKYRLEMKSIGKLEKMLILFGIIMAIRLVIIGVFLEGHTISNTFGLLTGDLAKIISGVILIRITKIDRLRSDIFNSLVFAVIIMISMHMYQIITGLNGLLSQGYTTPYFNYNTSSGEMRPFSTFLTPVTYGAYLASLCGFLFWYKPSKFKLLKWIVFGAGIGALIATQTRSAWIAFAVGMFLVFILQRNINWSRVFTIGGFLFCILICLLLINPTMFEPIVSRFITVFDSDFDSNAIRMQLWEGTIRAMVNTNWVLGYGQKSFTEVLTNYVPYDIASLAHPHQTFLEVLFRYGLFGLVLYIIILLLPVAKAIRSIRSDNITFVSSATLSAVLIFIVSSLFETMWGSFNVLITIFLLMGFASKEGTSEASNNNEIQMERSVGS